ncbi:MAG: Tab2/Atab2 family RNA-binding protein [Thermosynechococcaceae cyanobacterium]
MAEIWEIDFYSRPILDEKGKKLWEVLVCNAERTFEFTQFCAGSEANARWLQTALETAMTQWRSQLGIPESVRPEKMRFFRRPMTAIITRACQSLDIPAQPSQRTFALVQWLQERMQTVYREHPGYQAQLVPPAQLEPALPLPLPDALVGDGWSFVSLNFEALADMQEWDITFRDVIPLNLLPLQPDTVVPGLVIFSQRAMPLAGWMSGLEIASLCFEPQPIPRLLLETGLSDRWIVAPMTKPALQKEAAAFESAKRAAQQVHFLAIQSDPKDETFAGFWLLQTLAPT